MEDVVIARDFAAAFRAARAEVVAPEATLREEALALIERAGRLDGAVLDINLGGGRACLLVDALRACGVPMAFATGHDRGAIPARYADVPFCEKPVDPERIARALRG